MLSLMYFLNTPKMILETVLNISWISIYQQLTFAVLLTIHPFVSGCLSIAIKKFLIQKLEKMMLGDLRYVKLRREKCYKHNKLRRDNGLHTSWAKYKTLSVLFIVYGDCDGSVPVPFNFCSQFLKVLKMAIFIATHLKNIILAVFHILVTSLLHIYIYYIHFYLRYTTFQRGCFSLRRLGHLTTPP